MLVVQRDAVISKNQEPSTAPLAVSNNGKDSRCFERAEGSLLELLKHFLVRTPPASENSVEPQNQRRDLLVRPT